MTLNLQDYVNQRVRVELENEEIIQDLLIYHKDTNTYRFSFYTDTYLQFFRNGKNAKSHLCPAIRKIEMNNKFLITLSTAHLHPLEVKYISSVSLIDNEFSNLISINECVIEESKELNLVCLAELLTELKEKYNADYVLFDADEPTVDEFKVYDW